MSIKKTISIMCAFLILISIVAGCSKNNKQDDSVDYSDYDIEAISAIVIEDEFKNDESAAIEKYNGKYIGVYGYMKENNTEEGSLTVVIGGPPDITDYTTRINIIDDLETSRMNSVSQGEICLVWGKVSQSEQYKVFIEDGKVVLLSELDASAQETLVNNIVNPINNEEQDDHEHYYSEDGSLANYTDENGKELVFDEEHQHYHPAP